MDSIKNYLPTLARLLLCSLFIWDGVLQLRDPAGTMTYFTSLHIPAPPYSCGMVTPSMPSAPISRTISG